MNYYSTRDKKTARDWASAIALGLSPDGGLFVPEAFPVLTEKQLASLLSMRYPERAAYVMGLFLNGLSGKRLSSITEKAYGRFDTAAVAPTVRLDDDTWLLELWHGPTCAFKDIALQILPYLLTDALAAAGEKRKVCILVATSGDTGKAALEGFKDVPGTKIMVFYPKDGVSAIQELQMRSQEGENVSVCGVTGNFDDAQTGVKVIFNDESFRKELTEAGWMLSSANSINWGRLLPQIVYYFSAYCDLVGAGRIRTGDAVNFCVPTGNFGDILAGFYAKKMGLPVKKLICASNRNNVLTDFIRTGTYDRNRKFYTTISPSMDILVSSNLERLIFELSGKNDGQTGAYMAALSETGSYTVSPEIQEKLRDAFACGFCPDPETKAAIGDVFRESRYLMDPHTAVAYRVLEEYRRETGDRTVSVVVSTASAFKFCDSVLSALGKEPKITGTGLIGELERETGFDAPAPILRLKNSSVRFSGVADKDQLLPAVRSFICGEQG